MKTIQRTPPPSCLAHQPANQSWDGFIGSPCHSTVRQGLQHEQQLLCCYCESEVRDRNGHIEHMEPRSRNPARTYDYSNLALSCNGGNANHCGHFKDNRSGHSWDASRFLPPHEPTTAKLVRYLPSGSIEATSEDPDKASYLIAYLGLDCVRLTDRRRRHARCLINTLGGEPDEDLAEWLRQDHLQADGDGRLKQFYSLSKQILEP